MPSVLPGAEVEVEVEELDDDSDGPHDDDREWGPSNWTPMLLKQLEQMKNVARSRSVAGDQWKLKYEKERKAHLATIERERQLIYGIRRSSDKLRRIQFIRRGRRTAL